MRLTSWGSNGDSFLRFLDGAPAPAGFDSPLPILPCDVQGLRDPGWGERPRPLVARRPVRRDFGSKGPGCRPPPPLLTAPNQGSFVRYVGVLCAALRSLHFSCDTGNRLY